MIAVIFEVTPVAGEEQAYLDAAQALTQALDHAEGLISIERFRSIADPGKLLSYSLWRDDAAVAQWREVTEHRASQQAGRATLFDRYTIRVATVMREHCWQRDKQN